MKFNSKQLLANNGLELAGNVAMVRCIAAGLLKKNGARHSKDSVLPDHRAEFNKFKKQPKDYQRMVLSLAGLTKLD